MLYEGECGYDKGLLYSYFESGRRKPASLCKPLHAWSWNACFLSPSMVTQTQKDKYHMYSLINDH